MTMSPQHRKPERLVDIPGLKAAGIPLIKRFSGGGTVVVDHDTVFATLIMEGAPHNAEPCDTQHPSIAYSISPFTNSTMLES